MREGYIEENSITSIDQFTKITMLNTPFSHVLFDKMLYHFAMEYNNDFRLILYNGLH